MNISKFISKFFLTFLVFSSISIQGPIFAGSDQTESTISGVTEENKQQYEQYEELRELRARGLHGLFMAVSSYAASAVGVLCLYSISSDPHPEPVELILPFASVLISYGVFGMYDYLKYKAKVWRR